MPKDDSPKGQNARAIITSTSSLASLVVYLNRLEGVPYKRG